MGEDTKISWATDTFNAWWGCTKIAAPAGRRSACDHCYAADLANRYGHEVWGKDADRRFFGDKHWREPEAWNRKAAETGERRRVFCASMGDVFEDRRDLDEPRERLFDLIGRTPNLDWLLLTKRPEQMPRLAPASWRDGWPRNVWAGTTAEDQARFDLRMGRLAVVPAVVRFVSAEPLFGPISLREYGPTADDTVRALDWIIIGGESGGKQRVALDHDAALEMAVTANRRGIALFFKQDSGRYPGTPGPPELEAFKQFPTPRDR